jgi:hypothetical protein
LPSLFTVIILADESSIITVSLALNGSIVGLEIAKLANITVKSCKISKSENIKLIGKRVFTYFKLRFHIKVLDTGF